jgi:hypothetical protein
MLVLGGPGSLSVLEGSGLLSFWKVRARCRFGKSAPDLQT